MQRKMSEVQKESVYMRDAVVAAMQSIAERLSTIREATNRYKDLANAID